jgi:hypothetical protein
MISIKSQTKYVNRDVFIFLHCETQKERKNHQILSDLPKANCLLHLLVDEITNVYNIEELQVSRR